MQGLRSAGARVDGPQERTPLRRGPSVQVPCVHDARAPHGRVPRRQRVATAGAALRRAPEGAGYFPIVTLGPSLSSSFVRAGLLREPRLIVLPSLEASFTSVAVNANMHFAVLAPSPTS